MAYRRHLRSPSPRWYTPPLL